MQAKAGVLRTEQGLRETLGSNRAMLDQPQSASAQNALVTAEQIVTGALLRHESRGGHARTDYPAASGMPTHTLFTLAEARAAAQAARV